MSSQEVTVTIPSEYCEVTPGEHGPQLSGGKIPVGDPMVSLSAGGSSSPQINILQTAYRKLGEPDGVRCFIDGDRVALVPDDPEHPNAYRVCQGDSNTLSAGWLKHELASGEPAPGRYPLQFDGELWIVDFDQEPEKTGES